MHIRPGPLGLVLLICCCAGLSACTADASSGPDTTVSTPSVGRPPPPASAQAAVSAEAFTPYAALGVSSNDGLAPGESGDALAGEELAKQSQRRGASRGQGAAARRRPFDANHQLMRRAVGQDQDLPAGAQGGGTLRPRPRCQLDVPAPERRRTRPR